MDNRALRAVLWAGGFRDDAEFLATADPAEVLGAVKSHRVAGRFLARLRERSGAGVPDALMRAAGDLHEEQLRNAARIDADAAWLADGIRNHPAWDGRPVLLLKGNCASHLLGDPSTRRHSSDLDLLTPDAKLYERIFQDLGYRRLVNRACHEEGTFSSADRSPIDLHGYFPIWKYPADPYVTESGWAGRFMADWISTRRLEYETVLGASVPHPVSASGMLRLPDATLAVLMLCAHVFKDYVEPPVNQSVAKVWLAEICEIRDLAADPAFDADRFAALVREHRAEDVPGLACHILDGLGALPPALAGVDRSVRETFPQEVGFGLLVDARTSLGDMFVRQDAPGRFPVGLGSTLVPVGRTPAAIAVRAEDAEGKVPALWSTPEAHPDEHFDVDCRIREVDDGVLFELHSARGLGVYLDEISLFFGNELVHTARDVYEAGFRTMPDAAAAKTLWQVDAEGWRVSMLVPTETVRRHLSADGYVPVLVSCARFVEMPASDWNDFYRRCISSVCVPVRLSLPRAG